MTAGSGTVPICDLVDVCEQMEAANTRLFELLGGWVTDEPDPAHQQWFAVASHRHAWHAQLWSQRRPKVPHETAHQAAEDHAEPADRTGWYRDRLVDLQRDLGSLKARLDPTLDPSSMRVVRLVAADLADLVATAPPA